MGNARFQIQWKAVRLRPQPPPAGITFTFHHPALSRYSITGKSGGSSGSANVEAHSVMIVTLAHACKHSLGCAGVFSAFSGIFNSVLVLRLLGCSGNEAVGEEAGHVSQTHAATLGSKLHKGPGKTRKTPNLKAPRRRLALPAAPKLTNHLLARRLALAS